MLAGSMGFLTNGKGRITHGTLMGHLTTTIYIVSIDHHLLRIRKVTLNQKFL